MSTQLRTTWNVNHIGLPLIGCGSNTRAAQPLDDIESCACFRNPAKPETIMYFLPLADADPHYGATIVFSQLSLIGCAARRARDQQTGGGVPTDPMRTALHRRSRNLSIPHQLQRTGDDNLLLPDRHHTARCGTLSKLRLVYNASTKNQGPTPVQKYFTVFITR